MAKPNSKTGFRSWSTRDLLITIVIGLAFGVILIPVTAGYAALLSLGSIYARSLMGGLYFLPAAFAAYVMRKPGATLLASIISALVPMLLFPVYGFIVLFIGAMIGIVGELVTWVLTRYRNFSTARIVWVGLVSGLVVYLLILGSVLHTTTFAPSVLVAALAVASITFAICAWLGKWLADAVARTGVLANTALGQTNTDEI